MKIFAGENGVPGFIKGMGLWCSTKFQLYVGGYYKDTQFLHVAEEVLLEIGNFKYKS